MHVKLFLLLLVLFASESASQDIEGCPSYGCNPAGSFSFRLRVPQNATVAWTSDFFIGPLPKGLGCVGNSNNIVCQYNSPREVGFISVDVLTGKLLWKDGVLRFPELPVMDVFGDIIGSDGHSLVKYETNGHLDNPVIHLNDLIHPIYSLMVSDDNMVLIVSRNGGVFSYQTNGIPDAAIWLNGTVERTNGTFLPVSQPIININRLYILTEFKPDDSSITNPSILGMQRLYAIDVFDRMVDRLHITWFMNFEREEHFARDFLEPLVSRRRSHNPSFGMEFSKNISPENENLKFRPHSEKVKKSDLEISTSRPKVLYLSDQSMVYVYLPPPIESTNANPMLWGMKDAGDNSALLFKVPIEISSLATYRRNDGLTGSTGNINPRWRVNNFKNGAAETSLWAASGANIMKLSSTNGTVLKNIDLSSLLKIQVSITANVMVARETDNGNDTLVTGVKVLSNPNAEFIELCKHYGVVSNNTGYVVALTENYLTWMVATPNNTQVIGQIAGIPKPNPDKYGKYREDARDELVVFAGTDESSVIFAIH